MRAIDVASFQSSMNTGAVDADAVIVKFTQGLTYKNPYRVSQLVGALNAGKRGGAYHYASGAGTPEQEADFFVNEIRPYLGKITLWLDWETGNTAGSRNTAYTQHWAWVSRFINRVKSATGQECGLYYSASLHNIYKDKPIRKWVAQYPDYTPTGWKTTPWNEGAYSCDIRQYSSVGRINGYNGNVDLNKVYISPADWDSMAGNTTTNTETGDNDMVECIIAINGAHGGYPNGLGIYFSPQTGLIPLPDGDCVTLMNMIRHKEGKGDIPWIESTPMAPWVARAAQISVMSGHAPIPDPLNRAISNALKEIPLASDTKYSEAVQAQLEESVKSALKNFKATSETTTTLENK